MWAKQCERGVTLIEVSISLVVLTLFIGSGLRLYAQTMASQAVTLQTQTAENLCRSIHAEFLPELFILPLGHHDLGSRETEGITYRLALNLSEVDGQDPEDLRLAKYEVRYEVKNVEKRVTRSVLAGHRE